MTAVQMAQLLSVLQLAEQLYSWQSSCTVGRAVVQLAEQSLTVSTVVQMEEQLLTVAQLAEQLLATPQVYSLNPAICNCYKKYFTSILLKNEHKAIVHCAHLKQFLFFQKSLLLKRVVRCHLCAWTSKKALKLQNLGRSY